MRTLKPAKGATNDIIPLGEVSRELVDVASTTDNDILASCGIDGVKWADAFMANVINSGKPVTADWVAGWFANAITAGHDAAWKEALSAGKEQGAAEALASAPLYDPAVTLSDDVKEIRFTREQLIELRAGAFNEGKAASFGEHADAIKVYDALKAFSDSVRYELRGPDDVVRVKLASDEYGFTTLETFDLLIVKPGEVALFAERCEHEGMNYATQSAPSLPHPDENQVMSFSDAPIRIVQDVWNAWVDKFKSLGRDEHLRAGLNDTGDVPVLDLTEANAVEFEIDQTNKIWLNIDGRMRTRIGHANIIVLIDTNNRTVLRSPKADEAAPLAAELGDTKEA